MKLISENLGRIIAALAAIALLVSCVTCFRTDVGDFFGSILGKEQAIGESVLGKLDGIDLNPGDGAGDSAPAPEKNEYNFYFNQPYQMTMDGALYEYVFYEDGDASLWVADTEGQYLPAGTCTYDVSSINLGSTTLSVSEDGKTVSADGISMTVKFVNEGSIKCGVSYKNVAEGMSFVFKEDGSLELYGGGTLQTTLPAGSVVFKATTIEITVGSDTMVCPVYPDGGKLLFQDMVFKYSEPVYDNTMPIEWNSMAVGGNAATGLDGMPLVKVSNLTPSATELAGTEMSAMGETIPCEQTQDMNGFILAVYDEEIYVFSVTVAGNYAELGISFPETGLYVMDFGAMGTAADFVISPQWPTLSAPELSISGQLLTITPVDGATEYEVYIDGELVCATTETAVDLSEHLLPLEEACEISVRAIATSGYKPSEYGTLEYSLPVLEAPVISLSGKVLTITPVANATAYEIYVDGKLVYTVSTLTVDLSNNLTDDTECFVRVRAVAPGTCFPSASSFVWFSLTHPECGLYDANDELVASWSDLIGTYGLNIGTNYLGESGSSNYYKTSEGSMYYVLNNHDALATGVKLVIGDGVTSIGNLAFFACTSLTSVVIPDCVTSIGNSAFHNCTGLTNITIPDSVTSIGNSAFNNCTGLTNITIPDSVTSIAGWAFYGCTSLTNVTFGKNSHLTDTGPWAFARCSSLASVEFGSSLVGIERYAFQDCTSLTSIAIPDSVTQIRDSAFEGCTSLTSIAIPDSVTSIGTGVFADCVRLTNVAFGENSKLKTIGSSTINYQCGAFDGCTSLTSITIPDSVTTIGYYAFRDCTGLTSVTIGDGVTSIANSAFEGCESLTSITIPDSVTSIGAAAFSGCTSLTSIVVDTENPVYHSDGNCLIETASKTLISGCKTSIIPSDGSVTSIGSNAFDGCTGLTSITIPDSVTSIGKYAFYGCPNLTNVTFGENSQLTSIGISAFSNCTSLTSIEIPSSVTSIDSYVFSNCTRLSNIAFVGNMAQWDAISKISDWNRNCGEITVTCTDGTVVVPAYGS